MATELEELLGFLSSPSPQVRKAAVDIVSGLTGSEEGLRSLATRDDVALPALCRLLGDSVAGEGVARPAAEALVNLSQDAGVCEKLVSHGAVRTAVEVLYKQPQDGDGIHPLLVMLLVNLTQVDSGVGALLQVGDEKMEGLYVSKLVRSFCRSSAYETSGNDPFEHVGSILVNISKMEAGRKILLDPRRILLKQIIQQSDSANQLRKKGVFGTIRNCCFEADKQLQNFLSMSEFLWPALLLPVAGSKVYSQQDTSKMPPELANALSHERQPVDDPEIRTQALEAIYLISLQYNRRRKAGHGGHAGNSVVDSDSYHTIISEFERMSTQESVGSYDGHSYQTESNDKDYSSGYSGYTATSYPAPYSYPAPHVPILVGIQVYAPSEDVQMA